MITDLNPSIMVDEKLINSHIQVLPIEVFQTTCLAILFIGNKTFQRERICFSVEGNFDMQYKDNSCKTIT